MTVTLLQLPVRERRFSGISLPERRRGRQRRGDKLIVSHGKLHRGYRCLMTRTPGKAPVKRLLLRRVPGRAWRGLALCVGLPALPGQEKRARAASGARSVCGCTRASVFSLRARAGERVCEGLGPPADPARSCESWRGAVRPRPRRRRSGAACARGPSAPRSAHVGRGRGCAPHFFGVA